MAIVSFFFFKPEECPKILNSNMNLIIEAITTEDQVIADSYM